MREHSIAASYFIKRSQVVNPLLAAVNGDWVPPNFVNCTIFGITKSEYFDQQSMCYAIHGKVDYPWRLTFQQIFDHSLIPEDQYERNLFRLWEQCEHEMGKVEALIESYRLHLVDGLPLTKDLSYMDRNLLVPLKIVVEHRVMKLKDKWEECPF